MKNAEKVKKQYIEELVKKRLSNRDLSSHITYNELTGSWIVSFKYQEELCDSDIEQQILTDLMMGRKL